MEEDMRIVFLDRGSIGPSVVLNRPSFEHDWVEYDATDPEDVVARLEGADVAVSNKVPIDGAAIGALPDLKMIAIPATGYDRFDIAAARARGIVVSNVRGYAINTVPEHAFALIFALRRGLGLSSGRDRRQMAGERPVLLFHPSDPGSCGIGWVKNPAAKLIGPFIFRL